MDPEIVKIILRFVLKAAFFLLAANGVLQLPNSVDAVDEIIHSVDEVPAVLGAGANTVRGVWGVAGDFPAAGGTALSGVEGVEVSAEASSPLVVGGQNAK